MHTLASVLIDLVHTCAKQRAVIHMSPMLHFLHDFMWLNLRVDVH